MDKNVKTEFYEVFSGDLAFIRNLEDCVGLFRTEYTYLIRDVDSRPKKVLYAIGCAPVKVNNDEYRFYNPSNNGMTFFTVDRQGRGALMGVAEQPYEWLIDEDLFNGICAQENSDIVGVRVETTLCELFSPRCESPTVLAKEGML